MIQYTTALMPVGTWIALTNLVLPHTPYEFGDRTADGSVQRFYRVFTLGQGPETPPGAPALVTRQIGWTGTTNCSFGPSNRWA